MEQKCNIILCICRHRTSILTTAKVYVGGDVNWKERWLYYPKCKRKTLFNVEQMNTNFPFLLRDKVSRSKKLIMHKDTQR